MKKINGKSEDCSFILAYVCGKGDTNTIYVDIKNLL
jgi:hypothetical protein